MAGWPLVEMLHAYRNLLREAAARNYRHAHIAWALLAPHSKKKIKPPVLPGILKSDDDDT